MNIIEIKNEDHKEQSLEVAPIPRLRLKLGEYCFQSLLTQVKELTASEHNSAIAGLTAMSPKWERKHLDYSFNFINDFYSANSRFFISDKTIEMLASFVNIASDKQSKKCFMWISPSIEEKNKLIRKPGESLMKSILEKLEPQQKAHCIRRLLDFDYYLVEDFWKSVIEGLDDYQKAVLIHELFPLMQYRYQEQRFTASIVIGDLLPTLKQGKHLVLSFNKLFPLQQHLNPSIQKKIIDTFLNNINDLSKEIKTNCFKNLWDFDVELNKMFFRPPSLDSEFISSAMRKFLRA